MFDNFFNFNPSITQSGSWYLIQGIVFKDLELDFRNAFGTSTITSKLLVRLSASRFKIHQFFMVEFAYLLDNIVNTQNYTRQRLFRVNIGKYQYLYNEVKTKTWISSTLLDYDNIYDIDKALKGFKFKPFPGQRAFLEHYSSVKYGFQLKGILLDSAAGTGKAHSLDSNILTPTGFVKMRDIKPGDFVIGQNGKPTKVLAIHPQGKKQLYTVLFKDGRTEEVCEDHLWTVKHCGLYSTTNTKLLKEYIDKGLNKQEKVYVPLMEDGYDGPVKETELPLDPYLLGVLIGDGSFANGGNVRLTNSDEHIIANVREKLNAIGYRLTQRDGIEYNITRDTAECAFWRAIDALGLNGKLSIEKTIPDIYLNSTREVRLALLQGLMDTDGTADTRGTASYGSSSRVLAEQVQYLVRSLGGIARISSKIPMFTYGGERKEGKEAYRVNIRIKDTWKLFTLPRKKERVSRSNQYSNTLSLEMVSITPSRVDEAQCITVDASDHLYIASDFIVTHNTVTSLMWSRMVPGKKTIILVLKHLIDEPWLDHLKPEGRRYCFNKPPKVWVSTSNIDPRKSDAEYFIFYKEQLRKDDWKGITFSSIISTLSGNGTEPLKLIIDESHNYNDINSQQTQGAVEIGSNKYITDVLSMSGTPIKSAGKETYPLFCMIDKFFDKEIRSTFLKLYSRNNEALNELLAHRLGRIKFTINAINGLGEPPKPIPLPITFPGIEKYTLKNIRTELIYYVRERANFYQKNMPNYLYDYKGYVDSYQDKIENDPELMSELAVYRKTVDYFRKNGYNSFLDTDKSKFCKHVEEKIEADLKGEDLKYFRHIVPAVKYLPLKIRGEALGNVVGKARINAIVDTIGHIDLPSLVKSGIKKTAIYSTYIEAIDTAVDRLEADGCNPVRYHSGDKKSITEVISKLRDPKTDSIVTSFDSLSEGQPLLECNQLVLLNLPWRDYIVRQTIARIFREGQDTECFVWSVLLDTGSEENITTRTQDIVEYFKTAVDQILNGGLGFDYIEGSTMKLVDNTTYSLADLVPFEIPIINYRPKFLERSFTSMFR